ncbi:hypothetical protein SRHO_G00098540 [Serrasalmus rhombeus]
MHKLHFSEGESSTELRLDRRFDSSEPSCVSVKSDHSMDQIIHFREDSTAELRLAQDNKSDCPEPSYVSVKSDDSMDQIIHFREESSAELRMDQSKRSDCPELSCVSVKSDHSMDQIIHFREDSSAELRPPFSFLCLFIALLPYISTILLFHGFTSELSRSRCSYSLIDVALHIIDVGRVNLG